MTDPTPAEALKAGDDGPCTDCDDTGITFQTERRCACQGPLAPKTKTLAELEARAITAAAYRLTCSPHEWTDADSEAMAAYILARAALPSPATDAGEVRAAPSDEWRPIESAPKDGTEILAVWEDVGRGRYVCGVIAWIDPRSDGPDWYEGDSSVGPPKYWRPLPAPPAAAIRGLAR